MTNAGVCSMHVVHNVYLFFVTPRLRAISCKLYHHVVEYDTCRSLPVHAQYIYHIIKKPFGEPVKQFVKKNDVEKNFRYFDGICAYGSEVEEKATRV